MRVISHPNVNTAFYHGMIVISTEGVREDSRNGPAIVHPEPFTTALHRPTERVLFSAHRDANPFFHLFESFWMLGGQNDPSFLNQYISDFGSRFAEEDDGLLWGAYGHRWRNHFEMDQIERAIELLDYDPTSRRAVIAMWDADADLGASKKDIPCNTHIYLRLRPTGPLVGDGSLSGYLYHLDMTVCCRSNDAVWGLFGANAVHFSVLMEYLAFRLDVGVGSMTTVSNNAHIYEATMGKFDPDEPVNDLYSKKIVSTTPLFAGVHPGDFDDELKRWLREPRQHSYQEVPWSAPMPFQDLLVPMARLHWMFKTSVKITEDDINKVVPTDWRFAARQWLKKRGKI